MRTSELLETPLQVVRDHPWYPRLLSRCVRLPAWEDQEVGCLWWLGARSVGGQRSHEKKAEYGSIHLGGAWGPKVVRAHVAVATAAGLIQDFRVPLGYNLSHRCNRSLCVERRHLELVTTYDNQMIRHYGEPRPLTAEEEELIALRGGAGWSGRAPWWWPDSARRLTCGV